jgi:hypothetical protein
LGGVGFWIRLFKVVNTRNLTLLDKVWQHLLRAASGHPLFLGFLQPLFRAVVLNVSFVVTKFRSKVSPMTCGITLFPQVIFAKFSG